MPFFAFCRYNKCPLLWLLMVTLIMPSSAQAKEQLNIAAIDWCPQICPLSRDNPGYLVQMLEDLFASTRHSAAEFRNANVPT